jgi:ribosomal protein S18 acetylase RimI-like enzyme
MKYFLVEKDGQAVALAMLILDQVPGWPAIHPIPQIMDLHVDEACRRQGIGKALVEHLEQEARRRGCKAMHLRVEPENNPTALHLYERMGYRKLFDKPRRDVYDFVDGQGVRHKGIEWVVDMRKELYGAK